jgi:integrase
MLFVYRPKRKRTLNGKVESVVSPFYRGRYRIDGMQAAAEIPLKTRDRQVAEKRLRDHISDLQRESEGLIPRRTIRDAGGKSLILHLRDFITDLEVTGHDDEYVSHVDYRARIVFRDLRWNLPKDLDPDAFQQWRAGQTRRLSPKTLNEYCNALNVFAKWMVRNRRLQDNPFRWVEPLSVVGKERYVRRALSPGETERLLAAAGDRWLAYLVAVRTGLRRNELNTLAWGDVDLDAKQPAYAVQAINAKNRKTLTVALSQDVVEELKRVRPADYDKAALIFPDGVPSMETFKEDLMRAEIPHVDDRGRVVDFHSLRKTLCTDLGREGVSPWQAMKIMRHSDIKLTVKNYTDVDQMKLQDALAKLPKLGRTPRVP